MIPILYEKNETEFVSNGLCRLRDATSVLVTEEKNSIYECDFDYPVDGANFNEIRLGRIIAVEHDDTNDIQPFDIVSCEKPINGVVSFHAVHISYRQSKIVASGANVTSLEAAFAMLKSGQPSNPFTYWTDQSSTAVFPLADNIPRSVRECLGGTEGSILDTYGGEFEWDKFTVKLWHSRGSDVDFVIRYGVNMTEYNDESDSSESYSAIVPYWKGQNGEGSDTVIKGGMVTNGSTTASGRVDCVAMDFTQDFESDVQPTAAQLEALARQKLTTDQPHLPTQTIKVGFIRLQDSGEYGQFQNLLKCKLCDTVRVEFPRYNMSGRFKIVKTVYDVLLDRFTSMELGTLQTTLSEALGISSGSSSYSTTGGGGADYVVEQGTDGIWTYRKWVSGIAECWGSKALTLSHYYTVSGFYGYYTAIEFPSGFFVSPPIITYAARIDNNLALTGTITDSLTTDGANVYALSNASGSRPTSWYVEAKGRWK